MSSPALEQYSRDHRASHDGEVGTLKGRSQIGRRRAAPPTIFDGLLQIAGSLECSTVVVSVLRDAGLNTSVEKCVGKRIGIPCATIDDTHPSIPATDRRITFQIAL